MDITKTFNELMKDHRMYHTEFQRRHFITELSGVTTYGKYIQAVKELHGRYTTIKNNQYELKLIDIDIDELNYKLKNTNDEFKIRRLELKLEKKLSNREDALYVLTELSKEFESFLSQAIVLKEKLGELTPEKKEVLDAEFWEIKLKRDIAINHISGRGIDKNIIEIILSLPKDIRKDLIMCANDPTKAIEYFENKDIDLDNLPKLEYDIKNLIEE